MAADHRAERQQALRQRLDGQGLDALLVTHPPNIRYLTGFGGSAGMLVVGAERTILLTDSRYASQAPAEVGDAAEIEIEPTDLWTRLRTVLAQIRPGSLGFERDRLTVRSAAKLGEAFRAGDRLEGVEGLVEEQRVVKDADEVIAIGRAALLALDALEAVTPTVAPGDSELVVAGRLEAALRERGSEWHPFPTIVASGPRAALPHARTSEREIRRGDLLLLDFGAQTGGYCADLTRTVVIGTADPRQREVYEAVREAQAAALDRLRPGIKGRDVDAAAREALARRGFAEAFRHSLGHGLGLEVHEDPRLSRTSVATLLAGTVVTVEPGVYFEGWGGIRLEDDVVITSEGAVLLSSPPGPLLELGR
jgi:Xaa-Pro aminopeptidase